MIVMKLEMWPGGDRCRAHEIGRMYVANVGGTDARGDYDVAVCRRGTTEIPKGFAGAFPSGPRPTRTGSVTQYPRLAYNVWRLVLRALVSCFPEDAQYRVEERSGSDPVKDEE